MKRLQLAIVLTAVLGTTVAQAEVKGGVAVGATEYVGLGDQYLDTYPCIGGYLSFATPDRKSVV